MRPAYWAFKLLSLLRGQQLPISGATADVKGLAALSEGQVNVVLWNFPPSGRGEPREITLRLPANKTGRFRLARLNAARPLDPLELERSGEAAGLASDPVRFTLRPYEVRWLAISE